jgi:DNA-binding transcriptional LysR family regulator
MDSASLRLALAVARLGSIAAAAREHDLDPSSASRALAAAEAALGFRLFQRSTRRLSLTEAGLAFLPRAEAALAEMEAAREEAAALGRGPVGTLRLTASIAFGQACLVPLLPAFRDAFPGLRLDLLLTDARLDLVAERLDLAIRLGPRMGAAAEIGVRLFPTRHHLCAAPSWLARHPLVAPAALADLPCLLFALPGYRSRWLFRNGLRGAWEAVAVRGDLVVSSVLALREAALAGLGPALLPDWLVGADLAAGRLVDPFPDHRAAAVEGETAAWLAWPTREGQPAKTRAVAAFLRRHLGPGRAGPGPAVSPSGRR